MWPREADKENNCMKAMVIAANGGPEVFEEREMDTPVPGANEVLVLVRASSVNPADVGARRGMFGPHAMALPAVLGFDVAGTIGQVGPGVTGWVVGDDVYYAIPADAGHAGGYAEFNIAPASILARKPSNLSFAEAAAVPVAGGTAWAALISRAAVRVGETVLIHGGAGGVGSFAVQIARAAGAFVFATCGAYDAARVRELGAHRVIDYRTEKFADVVLAETGGKGVDVSFTTVGGPLLAESLLVTRMGGRAVTVTGPAAGLEGAQFAAMMRNLTIYFAHLDEAAPKLEALRTLIKRGQLKPLICATFPMTRVADAHRLQEQGGETVYGKIVLEAVP